LTEGKFTMQQRRLAIALFGSILVGFTSHACLNANPAFTQTIIPDGTTPSTVTPSGLDHTIINGTAAGTNLFHSFQRLDIPTGGSATFDLVNTPAITTIFSRVTGGSVSNLDGAIRTLNGTNPVSLFLMNPAGIIFGPNASLNIGGSFVGTSASSIKFANGAEFASSATPLSAPLLTISVPIGLQMGQNPGSIQLQGATLEVQPNQGLILMGGDIQQSGSTIDSNGGPIEIGSVQQPATIQFSPDWQFNYGSIQTFGDIHITNQSRIFSNGQGGGRINLQGRHISVTGLSYIWSVTEGDRDGQPLSIRASERLDILDVTPDGSDFSWIMTFVDVGATGQGSNLALTAPNILSDGTYVAALSYGSGRAGDLTIDTQSLKLVNSAQIATSTFASGNAGNLVVRAANDIEVSGFKPSNFLGEFYIFSSALFADADIGSTGNGGNVWIETNRLRVADGGRIAASVQSTSSGNAGSLTIRAQEMQVDGVVVDHVGALSGVLVDVQPGAIGQGGIMTLDVGRLQVLNGGQISASNFGTGSAGNVSIRAESIEVTGATADGQIASRVSATSQTDAPAGSISITAADIHLWNGGTIAVSSFGTGKAGNLTLQANTLQLSNSSQLKSESNGGVEGNIHLVLGEKLVLKNGSQITTNASASASGGNITISSPVIVGVGNSDIVANAIRGQGGNIQITTQGIFGLALRPQLTPKNDITASSEFGINGTVQINNLAVDPSNGLTQLAMDFADSSQQIVAGCAENDGSSFVATGRGGMPLNPTNQSRNDRTWADTRDLTAFHRPRVAATTTSPPPATLVQATGWRRNADGKVELYADTPAPVASEMAGVTCATASAQPH
jgi:filamentous hemagglutinin family protein